MSIISAASRHPRGAARPKQVSHGRCPASAAAGLREPQGVNRSSRFESYFRARLPGAKTRSVRSNFGPPSGVACPLGSAAPTPEATPAPLETSSPSATPKSAPALQTWAASNAGSVVNGRSTTPPAKATSSHSVATTMMGSSPNETSSTCFSTRHSAAASRRQQLQRSTALRARLNARALTAPRTLPTPASHLCHTTRNASPSLR